MNVWDAFTKATVSYCGPVAAVQEAKKTLSIPKLLNIMMFWKQANLIGFKILKTRYSINIHNSREFLQLDSKTELSCLASRSGK